jgi:hypothetical protein
MFDVDPGRCRLSAHESRNAELAENLGEELAHVLQGLRRIEWNRLRHDCQLDPDATEYDFWHSVWLLFEHTAARPDSAARRILFRLLQVALTDTVDETAILPNGFTGNLSRLTTTSVVRYRLGGALTSDSCAPLFNWAEWNRRGLRPETVVSARVADALQHLNRRDLIEMNLATIAGWLSHQTVRPSDARLLGEVLRALPDNTTQSATADRKNALDVLSTVRFVSKAGTAERASALLALSSNPDERRRALFAPDDRRLADDYNEAAVTFFVFCRGSLRTPPAELARWALEAKHAEAQRAALEYLANGELALEMQRALRELDYHDTWLANPGLVSGVRPELLQELSRPALEIDPESDAPFNIRRIRNPGTALQRIEQWWRVERAGRIRDYERHVYPNGRPPKLSAPESPLFNRSDWLVLCGRASFFRIGRSTDDQHRSFIEYSQNAGSWTVFSAAYPEKRADEWMGVLDDFCDDQIDSETWQHWMRSFVHLYKLSRWLEDYVEIFLGLDSLDGPYDLDLVLKSRSDAGQQGGGVDAPPPGLGIGACFVVRELLRTGLLRRQSAHQHAFIPTFSLRNFAERIGLDIENEASVEVSGQIYSEIARYLTPQKATFECAFDIPLQIIAADKELENQILD